MEETTGSSRHSPSLDAFKEGFQRNTSKYTVRTVLLFYPHLTCIILRLTRNIINSHTEIMLQSGYWNWLKEEGDDDDVDDDEVSPLFTVFNCYLWNDFRAVKLLLDSIRLSLLEMLPLMQKKNSRNFDVCSGRRQPDTGDMRHVKRGINTQLNFDYLDAHF